MKKLIAVCPILYLGSLYNVGDTLPTFSSDMVNAWLGAGTAVWKDTEKEISNPTALPASAEAGLSGSVTLGESDGQDLVGKVPKTDKRKK